VTITGNPTGGTFKLKFDGQQTAAIPFNATAERIHEYACHEANYSMANVLRGARAEEKKP